MFQPSMLVYQETVCHASNVPNGRHGGYFKYFLFSPLLREDFQFDYFFSDGLEPPTRRSWRDGKTSTPSSRIDQSACFVFPMALGVASSEKNAGNWQFAKSGHGPWWVFTCFFNAIPGEMNPILTSIFFSDGWLKTPTKLTRCILVTESL